MKMDGKVSLRTLLNPFSAANMPCLPISDTRSWGSGFHTIVKHWSTPEMQKSLSRNAEWQDLWHAMEKQVLRSKGFNWSTIWFDNSIISEGMAVPWTLYPVQEMDREETANVANQWGKCLCWTSFPFLDSFWISHLWTVFSSNLRQVKTDTDCCICLYLDVCLQSFPILKA